ncbi:MAG: glycosyltransferase family 2 protein [Bariatricus sp.]|nr:glycosyltransferase family 2 protein [Bariatricus sp.]
MKKLISIVVPCYNEGDIISRTADMLTKQLEILKTYDYEIVFVDDGSKDDTLSVLKEISIKQKNVKYISFSRNFGKESAMLAGLEHSKGDCVVIMDADLQHPPELIKEMLTKYEEGYDQVIAKRNRKGDAPLSIFFARMYYKLVNRIVDVKMVDGAGDFRLLSRRAVDAIVSLHETNRFSKGLFSWIGYKQTYIEYENRARIGGETKWSFKRLLSYGMDGIFSFNDRPLRICLYLGMGLVGIGFVYLLYLLIQIIRNGIDVPGYFTIILLVTCLGGTQLLSLGIIGEYIGRVYYEVKRRPNYFVQETNIENGD